MYSNHVYPTVTEALPNLLSQLDQSGETVPSRNGETKELTHIGITLLEPLDREILVEGRKPNLAAQIAETMWVLSGRDDIEWLENYLPRVRDFSDDGKRWRAGYGARLRKWQEDCSVDIVDQWKWVVQHLIDDPGSRRAVMSIWNPLIDEQPGKDIPCNDWLSFLIRDDRLDLHVAIRSNDVIWGWSGINQFEWSALLEITAGLVGVRPGSLHFSTTSFHLYDKHYKKAEKIRNGMPFAGSVAPSPRFDPYSCGTVEAFDELAKLWFRLEYDIRTGSPLVDGYIADFPEPMMRSWLRILQWWWGGGRGNASYLEEYRGTRIHVAALGYSMAPPRDTVRDAMSAAARVIRADKADVVRPLLKEFGVERVSKLRVDQVKRFMERLAEVQEEAKTPSPFIRHVISVHNEKHAAYGDSWKKRGEMFSIIPNIARKVDRLGGAETRDETSADTALDLLVYLAKYRTWLEEGDVDLSDHPNHANNLLLEIDSQIWPGLDDEVVPSNYRQSLEKDLRDMFERLATMVENRQPNDGSLVDEMLVKAYRLAVFVPGSVIKDDEYRGADVD